VRITTSTRQFQAYIKQYRLKEPGEAHRELMIARVEQDYKITRQLYERFSAFPQLNVPRPLACFPELLTLIFEESPGENFQEFIERNARGWPSQRTLSQLVDYCAWCGEWLKRFQEMLPVERHHSIPEMWEYVDHRLKQLVANPRAKLSESLRQQVHRYFDKLEARSERLDLRRAAVHADFCLANILVHPSGITVIDLAMFGEGSIYLDLTHLYHHFDLLALKPIFRPRVIHRLQQAFLGGYDPYLDRQNPMFEAFRLQHMTTHFLSVIKIPNPPPQEWCYNRWVCRHHRRWIEKVTVE